MYYIVLIIKHDNHQQNIYDKYTHIKKDFMWCIILFWLLSTTVGDVTYYIVLIIKHDSPSFWRQIMGAVKKKKN